MAFKTWQTGVHIQQDKVVAVALTRERADGVYGAGGRCRCRTALSGKAKYLSQNSWLTHYVAGGKHCRTRIGYFSHFR